MNANRFALAAIAAVLCVEACDALSAPVCTVTEVTQSLTSGSVEVVVSGPVQFGEVYHSTLFPTVAYKAHAEGPHVWIEHWDVLTRLAAYVPEYLRLWTADATFVHALTIECGRGK